MITKIRVQVIINSGIHQTFEEKVFDNISDFDYSSAGCYTFRDSKGKSHFYPINSTVIHELE